MLRYDADLGSIQTCGQHVLIAGVSASKRNTNLCVEESPADGFHGQILVDPEQRCAFGRRIEKSKRELINNFIRHIIRISFNNMYLFL